MATQALQDQFFGTLRASKSFQLLTPEEQSALLAVFANASDEQLQAGLAELQKDILNTQKLEAELKQREERQVKMAEEIKVTLKQIDKEELKENEAKDEKESSDVADKLLAKIGQEEEKPKRKKFLGIF